MVQGTGIDGAYICSFVGLGFVWEYLAWWSQWVAAFSPSFVAFCTIMYSKTGPSAPRPPYEPWDYVPPHVWKATHASNFSATQDDRGHEVEVCVEFIDPPVCGEHC